MELENLRFKINRAPVNIINVKPSHVNSPHLCSPKLEAYTKEKKASYIGQRGSDPEIKNPTGCLFLRPVAQHRHCKSTLRRAPVTSCLHYSRAFKETKVVRSTLGGRFASIFNSIHFRALQICSLWCILSNTRIALSGHDLPEQTGPAGPFIHALPITSHSITRARKHSRSRAKTRTRSPVLQQIWLV